MTKKVSKILTIISIIILILSILGAISIFTGIFNPVFKSGPLYVDGSNLSGFFKIFGLSVSFIFAALAIFYGLVLIFSIWILYAIVLFIIWIIKKITKKKICLSNVENNSHEKLEASN